MSQHTEFVDASFAEPFHLDGYRAAPDEPITDPVLAIDTGSAVLVFYGQHEDIIDLLNTAITAMVRKPIPEE